VEDLNKLAKQTLVYGLGTMLPRFLNYAVLTPFYTRIFKLGEYGIVTELYAYMVLMLVVLTYGMETGFFRFAQGAEKPEKVYSTALISLLVSSLIFIILFNLYIDPVSRILKYEEQQSYLRMFSIIIAIDAFVSIPFARLRRENNALKFSKIKIINVMVIIGLVIFLLQRAPNNYIEGEGLIGKYYNPEFGVGYVFLANLAGSIITLILLLPEIIRTRFSLDWNLWKRMITYSLPLLIAGMAGSINDALDKMILKNLVKDDSPLEVVGEYGASYKIAVLMALFIQMFRFAMEPYFFEKAKKKDAKETYARVMKYFVITGLVIFLGINLYLKVVQVIIGSEFRGALAIVPIVSMGYFFYGIFINLSIWYKVNDLTKYGAWLAIAGAMVTVVINVIFVPKYGYMASAWAHIACYSVMIAGSYFLSRKHYPISYELGKIGAYIGTAIAIIIIVSQINYRNLATEIIINTLFIIVFLVVAEVKDKGVSIFFKRNES
jgi:O-antigen/teichoic acid export membrane protein